MSSEEATKDDTQIDVVDESNLPTEPTSVPEPRKRPRLDVSGLTGGRDRKRGKSMFGILVGTLNKAKIEDKERSASEAAKKRQLIDQRLQAKLRKETDSVRRAEEAKKDKTTATRKEEELQLRDSVYKLRRTRLLHLSNFLLTSHVIPSDDSSPAPSANPLAPPPRSHPPPLYYLPVILTPSQEAFLSRCKAEVVEAADKEWNHFLEERKAGIEEVNTLRQRVEDEAAKKNGDSDDVETEGIQNEATDDAVVLSKDIEMEVDDGNSNRDELKVSSTTAEPDKKEDSAVIQDDDDAVEY